MVENISSVYFNDGKSIFTIFVNGSRPLKFSAWFKKKKEGKKKTHGGRRMEASSRFKNMKLVWEQKANAEVK